MSSNRTISPFRRGRAAWIKSELVNNIDWFGALLQAAGTRVDLVQFERTKINITDFLDRKITLEEIPTEDRRLAGALIRSDIEWARRIVDDNAIASPLISAMISANMLLRGFGRSMRRFVQLMDESLASE